MTFSVPVCVFAQDGLLLDNLPAVKSVQLGSKSFVIDAVSSFPDPKDKNAKIGTVVLKTNPSKPTVECTYGFDETQSAQLNDALISTNDLPLRGADRDRRVWKKSEFFDFDLQATGTLKFKSGLSMKIDPQSFEHSDWLNSDCKGKRVQHGKRLVCDALGVEPKSHSWFVKFTILIGHLHYKFDCSDQFAPLDSQGILWSDFLSTVGTDFDFSKE